MTRNDAIVAVDLRVTFQRWGQEVHALQGVTLEVAEGEWLMLIGDNGSGKSTFLRCICGRCEPTSGELIVVGDRARTSSPSTLASRAFYLHQNPLLGTAGSLTLFENLLVADIHAGSRTRRDSIRFYSELLEPFALGTRGHQLLASFSGGERQLISLLIAELQSHPVLLLDEPLSALDPSRRRDCLTIIQRLNHAGRTIVHVTHDHGLCGQYGDRVVHFASGVVTHT